MAPKIDPNPRLQSYYASIESVLGYDLILGGTRHFGYYDTVNSLYNDTSNHGKYIVINPFPIGRSLRRMEQQLFAALHLPPGSKVLDAGCGNGHVARYMARQGLRVTGIDVVERHARMARQTAAESSSLEPGSLEVHHMDYHHLEPFESASFDGAYTMETVVHAVDPEAVLAGFFRLLRPGGRVAMHEYDNVLQQDASASPPPGKINDRLRRSMAQVNEWSAMPTNAISSPGAFKHMLERAGFVDVEVRDLSENIVPMTRFFFALAIVPFLIISLLGLERYFINTVAGVQSYRGRGCWRYIQISARKPETPSGSSAAR